MEIDDDDDDRRESVQNLERSLAYALTFECGAHVQYAGADLRFVEYVPDDGGEGPRFVPYELQIVGADVRGEPRDLESVSRIGELGRLAWLRLRTAASSEILRFLRPASPIERLEIDAPITDRYLEAIRELRQLTSLKISTARVSDSGLRRLLDCERLVELSLPRGISDAGVEYLAQLRSLRRLDASRTRLTDAGISRLVEESNLQELSMPPTVSENALRIHAEAGFAPAEFELAIRLRQSDPHAALSLFERAAAKGIASAGVYAAAFYLGHWGDGPSDEYVAETLLINLAEAGVVDATSMLCRFYDSSGRRDECRRWLRELARCDARAKLSFADFLREDVLRDSRRQDIPLHCLSSIDSVRGQALVVEAYLGSEPEDQKLRKDCLEWFAVQHGDPLGERSVYELAMGYGERAYRNKILGWCEFVIPHEEADEISEEEIAKREADAIDMYAQSHLSELPFDAYLSWLYELELMQSGDEGNDGANGA